MNKALNSWYYAASEADFETYFGLMIKDGVLKKVKWERKIAHYLKYIFKENAEVLLYRKDPVSA